MSASTTFFSLLSLNSYYNSTLMLGYLNYSVQYTKILVRERKHLGSTSSTIIMITAALHTERPISKTKIWQALKRKNWSAILLMNIEFSSFNCYFFFSVVNVNYTIILSSQSCVFLVFICLVPFLPYPLRFGLLFLSLPDHHFRGRLVYIRCNSYPTLN